MYKYLLLLLAYNYFLFSEAIEAISTVCMIFDVPEAHNNGTTWSAGQHLSLLSFITQ